MHPLLYHLVKRSLWPSLLLLFGLSLAGYAVELSSGVTFFDRPPVLDRSQISNRSADVPNAIYQFTIETPGNAGEGLQKLEFEQVEGAETIRFFPNRAKAFFGRKDRSKDTIPVQLTEADNRWVLTFETPVEPGKTVTITLQARRNPSVAGTYFIGVTAFPVGEHPQRQFLGFGRFRIQEGRSNDDQ
ncbi:DUF2808 domain-containing protein [Alkalinema sp. FACHB-956]|uniref:DUF2808 domain-containing protein n=1 Tax=Alkalinema sp. FACHB-956 TaxID=2692768 RepID=UPI001689E6F5|nr:DUF2808 domain-containing protein [Alkalinema sp. FACHB-956]MBD2325379.1 DUF2808 domain-containing protein [Alkalinema sp. FACHB-956]